MLHHGNDCFFFQAEDGIRVLYVTGVQTCALPICRYARVHRREAVGIEHNDVTEDVARAVARQRSEERRVGKECRARWQPDPYKKKMLLRRCDRSITLQRRTDLVRYRASSLTLAR